MGTASSTAAGLGGEGVYRPQFQGGGCHHSGSQRGGGFSYQGNGSLGECSLPLVHQDPARELATTVSKASVVLTALGHNGLYHFQTFDNSLGMACNHLLWHGDPGIGRGLHLGKPDYRLWSGRVTPLCGREAMEPLPSMNRVKSGRGNPSNISQQDLGKFLWEFGCIFILILWNLAISQDYQAKYCNILYVAGSCRHCY